ncbi:MAG: hypothetical protein ACJA2M_001575 [Polaribacter sp.]|jgi:hypothetical protein
MNSLNFGKDTTKDKYEEFLQDYNEYMNDELSVQKAKQLAANAWHIADWAFEEYITLHNFTDIGSFRESLYPNCESLKVMHDLANASKHKLLTRPKADLKNTKEHQGDFCPKDFSSEDFDVSYLEIEKNDGTILRFKSEIENVKEFWSDYLEDN